jgi:HK97 family phage portal protein
MAFIDLVGLLTTPVAVIGRGERGPDRNRYEPGLDSGQPFQPMPSAAMPTSTTFQEAAENLFTASYVTYACVRAYADAVASMPLKVYERDGTDREEVIEGDVVDLFDQPSPQHDGFEFIEGLIHSLLIGGESPVELVKNLLGNRIVQMLLMRPDRFGPIVNQRDGLVGYQYVVGTQGTGYDPDEILFYKLTNPTNEWRGLSPITAARLSIETDLAAGRFNRNFLENGAVPGGVLETEQDLLKRERKEIAGEWQSVHGGINRAGRVAVLDKGLKFNGASLSQKDAQWLEGRQNDRASICAVYRISPVVLGIEGSSNRSEAEAAWQAWYKGPVRALVRRLEFKLTHVAQRFNKNYFAAFNMDEMLRPNFELRAEAGSKAWWITPDEKRAWEQLPKLPKDQQGDKIWVPVNMSAGGEPINEVAPPGGNLPGQTPPQLAPFTRPKKPAQLLPGAPEPAPNGDGQKVTPPFGR